MKSSKSGSKKPLPKENYHEHAPIPERLLPVDSAVASANECTGLMFTPPEDPSQMASYQELSPMAIPCREPGAPRQALHCPDKGDRPEKRQ